MKYMLMMFGDAASMTQTRSPEWIREMIAFMTEFDAGLRESGELVYDEGLADGSTAKIVGLEGGVPTARDGQMAGDGPSLIGFWIVDVADEARAIEIAAQIVAFIEAPIEVRPVPAGPPQV
jgi:hypothetical protein